jgi:hypothetical protein
MSKYDKMKTEELERRNRKLSQERTAIRVEQHEIARILGQRHAKERLAAIDAEAERLRQTVGPQGIDTEESVGSPGA